MLLEDKFLKLVFFNTSDCLSENKVNDGLVNNVNGLIYNNFFQSNNYKKDFSFL